MRSISFLFSPIPKWLKVGRTRLREQAMLQAERQRSIEYEMKYVATLKASEEGRRRLKETEKKVLQLRDCINRYY